MNLHAVDGKCTKEKINYHVREPSDADIPNRICMLFVLAALFLHAVLPYIGCIYDPAFPLCIALFVDTDPVTLLAQPMCWASKTWV